jgi:hypothetical protein
MRLNGGARTKKYLLVLLSGIIAFNVFAGGQTDSGRNAGMDTIEAGKFVNPATVDAYAYINDYIFPYAIDANEDLSVFVKLEI